MKKQGPLILAGLVVAAALYYFFLRKGQGASTSAAARSGGSGAGGPTPITPLNAADFVPTSTRPAPISGAPVPSLATSLATSSVQTLGSILSRLVSGGGGGSGSSGSGSSSPFNVRGTPIGNSSSLTGFPSRSNSQLSTTGGIGHAPPDTSQGPYYRDPSTGILYDPNGNPVGEQPQDTSPGIPYNSGGTVQSVDLSSGGSADFGGELGGGGGYQDTSGTYSDSGGVSSADLSGGDSGGGGGGGDLYNF